MASGPRTPVTENLRRSLSSVVFGKNEERDGEITKNATTTTTPATSRSSSSSRPQRPSLGTRNNASFRRSHRALRVIGGSMRGRDFKRGLSLRKFPLGDEGDGSDPEDEIESRRLVEYFVVVSAVPILPEIPPNSVPDVPPDAAQTTDKHVSREAGTNALVDKQTKPTFQLPPKHEPARSKSEPTPQKPKKQIKFANLEHENQGQKQSQLPKPRASVHTFQRPSSPKTLRRLMSRRIHLPPESIAELMTEDSPHTSLDHSEDPLDQAGCSPLLWDSDSRPHTTLHNPDIRTSDQVLSSSLYPSKPSEELIPSTPILSYGSSASSSIPPDSPQNTVKLNGDNTSNDANANANADSETRRHDGDLLPRVRSNISRAVGYGTSCLMPELMEIPTLEDAGISDEESDSRSHIPPISADHKQEAQLGEACLLDKNDESDNSITGTTNKNILHSASTNYTNKEKTKRNHDEGQKFVFETPSSPSKQERGLSGENIRLPSEAPLPATAKPAWKTELTFKPTLTARYPPKDRPDNPLNPMLPHFCFPETDFISATVEYMMPKIHHFVLTNDKGNKMYGTCLTVYEEFVPPEDRQSNTQDSPLGSRNEHISGSTGIEVTLLNGASKPSKRFSSHRRHTLYVPRVLCVLSSWPYLSAFRDYLAQLYRLATSTNLMKAPLERYVLNICSEVPAPPPGAFEVQMSILDYTIRFWAPPANQPIPYVALPFGVLFECLDVANVLFVWYALALERKVLLVSSQSSLLAVCAEILCSLLFPMQWSHLYVPILPKFLSPMLDAPMPYLCGLSRDCMPFAVGNISDETIVVDLDQNVITKGIHMEEVPPMPYKRRVKLETSIDYVAGEVFWNARGLTRTQVQKTHKSGTQAQKDAMVNRADKVWQEKLSRYDDAFDLAHRPDQLSLFDDLADEDTGQTPWDRIQEAFLRFYVTMLKDYRKFLVKPDPKRKSETKFKNRWGGGSFYMEGFIQSQRSDFQPFLEELCLTQQFDDFITKRLIGDDEPDVIFFDQSIDAKMNRSKLKLKKVHTPFLQSAKAHKLLRPITAIEPSDVDLPHNTDIERKGPPFIYSSWPEHFEKTLFGKARPIPKIITAEFDRRRSLAMRLRAKYTDGQEDDDFWDLYSNDCDPSAQVATFTVFFTTYAAVIGHDLQILERKKDNATSYYGSTNDDIDQTRDTEPAEDKEGKEGELASGWSDYYPTSFLVGDGAQEENKNSLCTSVDCLESCGVTSNVILPSMIAEGFGWTEEAALAETTESENSPRENTNDNSQWSPEGEDLEIGIEEAREFAKAQLDMAFDVLMMLRLRKHFPDPDVYKHMMDCCGRCGDTEGATELMSMITSDGLIADGEIYAAYMLSFENANAAQSPILLRKALNKAYSSPDMENSRSGRFGLRRSSAGSTSSVLSFSAPQKQLNSQDHVPAFNPNAIHIFNKPSKASDTKSDITSSTVASTVDAVPDMGRASAQFFTGGKDFFTNIFLAVSSPFEGAKGNQRKQFKRSSSRIQKKDLLVTDPISKQILLGNDLLQLLYPSISLDTDAYACPQCSCILTEDDVVAGWSPCEFQDYSSSCPQCKERFVPHFVVSCSSPTFNGSQGKGTPLYCEFLSPWVLRKELHNVITGVGGIERIMSPEWRNGTDVNATLWWNMIVLFKRYKIPITFLLQGSFKNRLITPKPDSERF